MKRMEELALDVLNCYAERQLTASKGEDRPTTAEELAWEVLVGNDTDGFALNRASMYIALGMFRNIFLPRSTSTTVTAADIYSNDDWNTARRRKTVDWEDELFVDLTAEGWPSLREDADPIVDKETDELKKLAREAAQQWLEEFGDDDDYGDGWLETAFEGDSMRLERLLDGAYATTYKPAFEEELKKLRDEDHPVVIEEPVEA